jgi:hypothetical protein
LPGLQSVTQSISDYQRRQAQRFRLKPAPAAVDHLMQPFFKPPTANVHRPFLTGFPNLVNSSF